MIPATVLAFVVNESEESDLDRLFQAIKDRRKALHAIRAAQVCKDATVTLDGLSPKALNGLKGKVEAIRGTAADVLLDDESTSQLAFSRTKFATQARYAQTASEGYLLHGVPLGCCVPAA